MNKTLIEQARSMLSTARLDKRFWAKVASTASFLVNKASTVSIGLKISKEVWFDKPLDYFFLCVFNCDAYI